MKKRKDTPGTELDHDGLQLDLRRHLMKPDRIVMVELHLGSPLHQTSVGRADVFTMDCRYHGLNETIYEVKFSTSDLAADLRLMKYRRYLPYCDRLIFALGPNVSADAEREIPDQFGIIRRGPNGWRTTRKCQPHERPPLSDSAHQMAWAALAFHLFKESQRSSLGRLDRLVAQRIKQEQALIAESRFDIAKILGGWAVELGRREKELDSKIEAAEGEAWYKVEEALGERPWRMGYNATPEERALRVLENVKSKFINAMCNFVRREAVIQVADEEFQRQVDEAKRIREANVQEDARRSDRLARRGRM